MEDAVKLLIVDDEPLARLRISTFDLEQHGFTVVGEAENGREALEQIPVLKPDIIVTDIVMPVMDGLQLLTEIQKLQIAPKVVLLTCYDDFSKAQAALRLGALDYIVKIMLREEDFIEVIHKVSKVIQKEKQAVRKAIRKTLNDLMLAGYRELGEEYVQQLFEMGFRPAGYRFLLLELEQTQFQAMEAYKLSIENWEDDIRCIVVNRMPKRWTVLLYTQSGMQRELFEEKSMEFCRTLLDRIGGTSGNPGGGCMQIIAGNRHTEVNRLPEAYNSLYSSQKLLFYADRGEGIIPESRGVHFFMPMPGTVFQGFIDKFRDNFAGSNGKGAAECLLSWLAAVREEYRPLPEDVKIMASLLATCIPDSLTCEGELLQNRMKAGIDGADHMEDIRCIFECAAKCIGTSLKNSELYLRSEIRKALAYVQENYGKDISLEMVSDHVKLSASWFSSLFRTEMRQSFSEYLAAYRITEAKKLLEQTDLAISRIGETVGIGDPHYFSRLFAKSTGQSPKEYRNAIRG